MDKMLLTKFDLSLGSEDSFWHDYNLEVASELLIRITDNDWLVLQELISSRSRYWQERCAEAIGYTANESGVEILITFLNSPHMSVAEIAVTQLDDMSVSLPRTFERRLREILAHLMINRNSRLGDVQNLIRNLL